MYLDCSLFEVCIYSAQLLALVLDIVDELEGGVEESADAVGEAGRLVGRNATGGDVGDTPEGAEMIGRHSVIYDSLVPTHARKLLNTLVDLSLRAREA